MRNASARPPAWAHAALAGALLAPACESTRAPESPPGNGGEVPACSQFHRDLSRWQGEENAACGADLTGLVELMPLGNGRLLARKRFQAFDDLWRIAPDGTRDSEPTPVAPISFASWLGFTLLPGAVPKVLSYSPRSPELELHALQAAPEPRAPLLASPAPIAWSPAAWRGANGAPVGHHFIGLPDGYLLDRDLGDGATRVWRFVSAGGATALLPPADLAPPPRDSFRRGHRLVPLDAGRLLEWMPAPCATADDAGGPPEPAGCTGAEFRVWRYAVDDAAGPRITFDPEPAAFGFWPDVGAGHDLVADEARLYLWTRATGALRSYALDPGAADPLSGPAADAPPDERLRSVDWTPPTASPALRHLVVIMQDGRSFDAYFGRYCQGAADPAGAALA
jgi:hypothetical protein